MPALFKTKNENQNTSNQLIKLYVIVLKNYQIMEVTKDIKMIFLNIYICNSYI